MVRGKTRQHQSHVYTYPDVSLLKFSALYGANASGKSNFVKAIKLSQQLILDGIKETITYDKYCKVDKSNIDEETLFEYEVVIDDVIYAYGFSVNLFESKINREWLYSLKNDKETEIFTRQLKSDKNVININFAELNLSKKDIERLTIYKEDFEKNYEQLFIKDLTVNRPNLYSGNKRMILNKVFYWFAHKLEVISPDESPSKTGITYLRNDDGVKLIDFLRTFGIGITAIDKQEVNEKDVYKDLPSFFVKRIINDLKNSQGNESKNIMIQTRQNIYEITIINKEISIKVITFQHETEGVLYTLGEESDGTIRLIELFDILANEKEKVYVVDELDRSLHPNLTFNFIKYYLNKRNNGQLIVTTHEDRILSLEVLRRDEVWFVEKSDDGSSELYSLEKFQERFDKNIWKAYLDGRYGSVPNIDILYNHTSEQGG